MKILELLTILPSHCFILFKEKKTKLPSLIDIIYLAPEGLCSLDQGFTNFTKSLTLAYKSPGKCVDSKCISLVGAENFAFPTGHQMMPALVSEPHLK